MNLENQVVSLELAKQLKELGVEQDSLFYWTEYDDMGNKSYFVDRKKDIGFHTEIICSAFTVAELGEMLPLNKINCYKAGDKDNTYYFHLTNVNEYIGEAETEADARAKMLIWLIENNYLSVES